MSAGCSWPGWRPLARAGAILGILACLAGLPLPASAQTEIPPPALSELQAAVAAARANVQREVVPYIQLGNPYTLETKRRQAQAGADAYIASVVQNLLARYPTRAQAIVEQAVTLAPESRRSILAVSGQVVTTPPPPAAQTPSWYASVPPAAPAPYQYQYQVAPPPPMQPAGTPPAVPFSWYDQPKLNRYGPPRAGQPPPAPPPSGPPAPPAFAAPATAPESGAIGIPTQATDQIVDPLEPINRGILAFNDIVDFALLKPAATVLSYAPDFVKESIRNVLSNLRSPVTFANDVMQFTFRDAARTFDRFVINSTIGVGGLWDPADKLFGIKGHRADFGQTLYSHGATAGPYLVLPLLGPSSLRDGFGLAVDSLIDPWGYFLPTEFTMGRIGLTAISTREELLEPLDELRKSSIDWYAGLRGAYYQARARELLKHPERAAARERQAVDDLFDVAE